MTGVAVNTSPACPRYIEKSLQLEQGHTHMPLICKTCGTVNQDLGGDAGAYRCGHCGQPTLQRTSTITDADKKRLTAAIAGATIVGLATENPVGALIGALLGYVFGEQLFRGLVLKK